MRAWLPLPLSPWPGTGIPLSQVLPSAFPLSSADSLLAVIYGRARHKAHRLENFQFTQEFPEK